MHEIGQAQSESAAGIYVYWLCEAYDWRMIYTETPTQ